MPLFQNATFFTTVANLRDLPHDTLCEVAFAGRSNAGKSSAINTLANHTRLAFVSKTPGRTQNLNYFQLADGKYLVDLPGYGYAKAPDEVRDAWEGLLGPYLAARTSLRGVVLIMDSRHPLTDLDMHLIDWFAPTGKPIHILLTKADKLTRQQQTKTLSEVRAAVSEMGDQCSVSLFSSLKKTGIEVAEAVLGKWLDIAPPDKPVASAKRQLAPGEKRNPELAARLAARKNAKAEAKASAQKKAPGKGGTGG